MHSYWSRASFLSSLYVISLLTCGLWSYLGGKVQERLAAIPIDQGLQNIKVTDFGWLQRLNIDAAKLSFSAEVDLTNAFTWSTNIIFVYLTVAYETPSRPRNEVVVWDKIVRNKADAKFVVSKNFGKYYFQEYSKGHIFNQPIEATLHYYQMPNTGLFHDHKLGKSQTIRIPTEYTSTSSIRK